MNLLAGILIFLYLLWIIYDLTRPIVIIKTKEEREIGEWVFSLNFEHLYIQSKEFKKDHFEYKAQYFPESDLLYIILYWKSFLLIFK